MDKLRSKIDDMAVSLANNQRSLSSIADSIRIYRQNMDEVIGVNLEIGDLKS